MIRAVRGAVHVENNRSSIQGAVTELVSTLVERNNIDEDEIVSIVFSQTHDVDAFNPATALRALGYASVPLFCTQEPRISGSPEGLIRVLLTCSTERKRLDPVYLRGAEHLRADLFDDAAQA